MTNEVKGFIDKKRYILTSMRDTVDKQEIEKRKERRKMQVNGNQ